MKCRYIVLALFVCFGMWGCRPSQPIHRYDDSHTTEVIPQPEPEPEPPKPEPEPPKPEPEPPEPEPVIEAQPAEKATEIVPPTPESTVEDRLREVLAQQKAIKVPHELPDGSATVVRLEPDGIHVRSSSGIGKISIYELSDELLEKYHISRDTAEHYQVLMQRQILQAQAQRNEQAKVMQAEREKQSEIDRGIREQSDRMETERQQAQARALWSEYDNRYQEYLQRRREKEYSRSWGRTVTMPKPPTPPKVPRPPMQ